MRCGGKGRVLSFQKGVSHTHIYLDYVLVEFLFCKNKKIKKKREKKRKVMSNDTIINTSIP